MRSFVTAFVIASSGLWFGAGPAVADAPRCEANRTADRYLSEPVEGMTPAVIADVFIDGWVLPNVDDSVRDAWKASGPPSDDAPGSVEGGDADSGEDGSAPRQGDAVAVLSQAYRTIVAFEEARLSADAAAELLAGDWDDWRSDHMSRDDFVAEFVAEAAGRQARGVPAYEATLHAAQVLRNRLDDMYGAAGARTAPEDAYTMWSWDSYLRKETVREEIDALLAVNDGRGILNDYLISRRSAITCAGARLESGPDNGASALETVVGEIVFPMVGYTHPELFRAIYDGKTGHMRVSQVGFYLSAFLGMFVNAEDLPACRRLVSPATLAQIAAAGSADLLGQIFGGLARAHQDRGGSRDDLFGQGFGAGAETFGGMALSEAGAQADAQLFYDLHGCDSPVADRFFGNIAAFADQG